MKVSARVVFGSTDLIIYMYPLFSFAPTYPATIIVTIRPNSFLSLSGIADLRFPKEFPLSMTICSRLKPCLLLLFPSNSSIGPFSSPQTILSQERPPPPMSVFVKWIAVGEFNSHSSVQDVLRWDRPRIIRRVRIYTSGINYKWLYICRRNS